MPQIPHGDDDRTVIVGAAGAVNQPQLGPPGHNALAIGTQLGKFEIIGLIGTGGFGIVYLAYDPLLDCQVALKEYMPSELAHRDGATNVVLKSQRHAETFAAGLASFTNEARLLRRFNHPSLVMVHDYWEANGTAYMVMPFYEGVTLKEALRELGRAPDEAWLRRLLSQLLDAMATIHAQNCWHRDIAPDNILMLPDGTPLLLDFGAARRTIGNMTQALTVILKPGYAPIEQYAEIPNMNQGPWTDLYALAAVIYFAITGHPPVPAVARVMSDPLLPLANTAAGQYSKSFLTAIDSALAVKPEDRPQDIGAFRRALDLSEHHAATRYLPSDRQPYEHSAGLKTQPLSAKVVSRRNKVIALGSAALVVLLLYTLSYILFGEPVQTAPPAPAPSSDAKIAADPMAADQNRASPSFECEPYCEVVSFLSSYATQRAGAPRIGIKGGGTSAFQGDKLVAELTGSDFAGYVYVDLYDPEGSVVHMLPNAKEKKNRMQPRQQVVLGDDPLFGIQWDVVPPLGKHLLVVVVSRSQLFKRDRPQVEPAAGYLSAMQERLNVRSGDDPFVMHYAVLEFMPKR